MEPSQFPSLLLKKDACLSHAQWHCDFLCCSSWCRAEIGQNRVAQHEVWQHTTLDCSFSARTLAFQNTGKWNGSQSCIITHHSSRPVSGMVHDYCWAFNIFMIVFKDFYCKLPRRLSWLGIIVIKFFKGMETFILTRRRHKISLIMSKLRGKVTDILPLQP